MGKFLDAFSSLFFDEVAQDAPAIAASEPKTSKHIPPRNDHAYYVNRLDSIITAEQRRVANLKEAQNRAAYANKGWDYDDDEDDFGYSGRGSHRSLAEVLSVYSLSTLQMMDEHHRLQDLDYTTCTKSEYQLRSILLISAQTDNRKHDFRSLEASLVAMTENHTIDYPDLTKASSKQAKLIGTACNFMITTGLYRVAPPRLTEFVMQRPDRVEDIISYVKTYCPESSDAHTIDLDHVSRFLDSPAQSLREGEL